MLQELNNYYRRWKHHQEAPGQHQEGDASLFLPAGQPSQDFGDNQLNGSEPSMLLVLFSQHAKPETIIQIYTSKIISWQNILPKQEPMDSG